MKTGKAMLEGTIIKVAAATFRRPLEGISVSGLWFRCFGHWISKFLAQERRDFNISGSGALGFQDFWLWSVEIMNFKSKSRILNPGGGLVVYLALL